MPEATANEVTIEQVGPALTRLTITIPPDTVAQKIEESIGTFGQEATLPGFRKGKVPRQLLEKRFGSTVRTETKHRLIADAYAQAIEEHGILPVGEPEPTEPPEKIELQAGKPLSFAVDVEVVPEFELPSLEGIEIKKPLLEITDEHVADRIRRQQDRLGTAQRVEGGFQAEDRIGGQVSVHKEGDTKPLVDGEAAIIICPGPADGGRGPVLGLMVEGLAGLLQDKRVGDTLTIETTGPEAHEREDIRGAKLTINFRITAAERPRPASVEQLVETFGIESQENLKAQMRLALQHQRDQEQASAMREQVYDYLRNAVEMELPEKLSAAQAIRSLEGRRIELLNRGVPEEEVEHYLAEIRADSDSKARDRLKLFFLLRKLGDHFKINVSEQEVNGRVATMAIEQGQRPDQLRAELARTGQINEVARMLRDEKAADKVIEKAAVEEVPAEKWNEMMKAAEGKPPAVKKKTAKKAASSPKAAGATPKTRAKKE